MKFKVTLDRYEGPYTKLLSLIEERKLSITEVSLVSVADDYLAYIQDFEKKDILDISQFIVVASTLMLMKVKSLLPGITYTEEEEKEVTNLEQKLILYTMLTDATAKLRPKYNASSLYFRARSSLKDMVVFSPDKRLSSNILQSIAHLTLSSFILPKNIVEIVVKQAIRIEHVIEKLLKRVNSASGISLKSFAENGGTEEERKNILILNFIALLELVRIGALRVEQPSKNGDIQIYSHST